MREELPTDASAMREQLPISKRGHGSMDELALDSRGSIFRIMGRPDAIDLATDFISARREHESCAHVELPKNLVKVHYHGNPDADEAHFVVPGWNNPRAMKMGPLKVDSLITGPLINNILKKDHFCIEFELDDRCLSGDLQATERAAEEISDFMAQEIKRQKERGKKTVVHAFSLGTAYASMAVDKAEGVDKLVLICSSDTVAHPVLTGVRTDKVRQSYDQAGFERRDVVNHLANMAPAGRLKSMRKGEICLVFASNDDYIPPRYARALAYEARRQGIELKVTEHKKAGHISCMYKEARQPTYL